jgi:hypothetical protein
MSGDELQQAAGHDGQRWTSHGADWTTGRKPNKQTELEDGLSENQA